MQGAEGSQHIGPGIHFHHQPPGGELGVAEIQVLGQPSRGSRRVLELLGNVLVELREVRGQRLVSLTGTDAMAETLLRNCRSDATLGVGQ